VPGSIESGLCVLIIIISQQPHTVGASVSLLAVYLGGTKYDVYADVYYCLKKKDQKIFLFFPSKRILKSHSEVFKDKIFACKTWTFKNEKVKGFPYGQQQSD
jgi:hypothetical protein